MSLYRFDIPDSYVASRLFLPPGVDVDDLGIVDSFAAVRDGLMLDSVAMYSALTACQALMSAGRQFADEWMTHFTSALFFSEAFVLVSSLSHAMPPDIRSDREVHAFIAALKPEVVEEALAGPSAYQVKCDESMKRYLHAEKVALEAVKVASEVAPAVVPSEWTANQEESS